MNVSVDNQIRNMYTCSSKRVSLTATSIFYLLKRGKNKMNLIRGKYKVYQKRNIIMVSVNEGYVTEARVINKGSDGHAEGSPRVVTVHKGSPKVDYREAQPSKHKLHLGNEKLDDFLLGLYVGVVLTLILVLWVY